MTATEEQPAPGRWVAVLFVVVVAASFGPYITGSIRTDQPLIYLLVALTVVFLPWTWLTLPSPAPIYPMMLNWGIYAAIGLVSLLGATPASLSWPTGSALAGMDNLLLPLAAMTLGALYVRPESRSYVLRWTTKAVAILAAANGALAIVMTQVDLSRLMRNWWASADLVGGKTTAEFAAELGRVSGVFNQPAEAGLLYGIAGVCAVYVWREKPIRLYLILTLVVIGGLLAVSKIFILGAIPVLAWQVWRTRHGKLGALFAGGLIALGVAQTGLFANWSGAGFLGRLFQPGSSDSLVDLYSAGRFGSSSTLSVIVNDIMGTSPVIGVGARGLTVPYDNGWVEALVVAGIVGVACYTIALVLFARLARKLEGPESSLMWGLTIVATAGSLGLPALTANRAGLLLWLVVSILAVQHVRVETRPSREWLPTTAKRSPARIGQT